MFQMEIVVLEIAQGKLRGKKVTSSATGTPYCSFQGIPYAKPPLGPLRFKPPEDPEPWAGIRDATSEGAVSLQADRFSDATLGNEDCLFLNVFTPGWPVVPPRPVMVWIHGGKFMSGSGNMDSFGPDFLVAEGIILVTLNYRLGALGFLYLEGADITGNNGMRDVVMALKWVQNNIAQFGGDPGHVTIFGESAGGAIVHFLMLSPLASGLFHRAIAQSGTAFIGGCNVPRDVSSRRALCLARLLGCASEEPQEVVHFLRTVPAEMFIGNTARSQAGEELHQALLAGFYPGYEAGQDAFLPDSPRNLLEGGKFTKVPFITGVTSAEGKVTLFRQSSRSELAEKYKDLVCVLPMELANNVDAETRKEIASAIKKFYFGEKDPCEETISNYIDMQSDMEFVFPLHEVAKHQAKWSPHPTFLYLFDHKIAPGFASMRTSADDIPGVPHAGELVYLFHSSKKRGFQPGSPDSVVRATMVKMWTQFAKTGNPSNGGAGVTWVPATNERLWYLKINEGFNMDCDMFKRRMKFMEDLYKKFLPKNSLN